MFVSSQINFSYPHTFQRKNTVWVPFGLLSGAGTTKSRTHEKGGSSLCYRRRDRSRFNMATFRERLAFLPIPRLDLLVAFLAVCGAVVSETSPVFPAIHNSPDAALDARVHLAESDPKFAVREEKERAQEQLMLQKEILKEMFEMEIDPADIPHDFPPSNYMLELYNEIADNRTGSLLPAPVVSGVRKHDIISEKIMSIVCRGERIVTFAASSFIFLPSVSLTMSFGKIF